MSDTSLIDLSLSDLSNAKAVVQLFANKDCLGLSDSICGVKCFSNMFVAIAINKYILIHYNHNKIVENARVWALMPESVV